MAIKFAYKIAPKGYQLDKNLADGILADRYGFDLLRVGNHFHPWFSTNSACGFAWIWMALAAQRTRNVEVGTFVTAPILRYHPAIAAQASATTAKYNNIKLDRLANG